MKSKIEFEIDLDKDRVPEKIVWKASDQGDVPAETKSISLSLWDDAQKNTLRIDLWTKEMAVDEMKRFYVDCLGGISQTLLSSTGDEFMANQINELCDVLVEHIKKEHYE